MPTKSRKKRLSLWILFLTLAVSGVIAGGIWYYFSKTNQLKSELTDFVLANPDSTAIVAYTFNDEGEFVEDEFTLFHNADDLHVMASTVKIVVLAAYADEVGLGNLDPNEQISVKDWEKYYLPMTDGGAHSAGLKSLGLEVDEFGFARNQAATIQLEDVARIMIHYSGNAATDYLLMRIGDEKMVSVLSEAGLEHHTPIIPILSTILAVFNHENSQPTSDQLLSLITDVSEGNTVYLDHLLELYLNDKTWRNAQIEFMTSDNFSDGISEKEMWDYQETASQLFPHGTAREYAQLMTQIASGQFVSPEVSMLIQQQLESVPSDWPLRLLFFDRFGAKDGITVGVLTMASYAVPKRSPLKGQYRVVVVLTNHMPLELWQRQLQLEGHYLLQTDLAQASGVFTRFRTSE